MNIIEARKAVEEGRTVICPDGEEWDKNDFHSIIEWWPEHVFGEWKLKPEKFLTLLDVLRLPPETRVQIRYQDCTDWVEIDLKGCQNKIAHHATKDVLADYRIAPEKPKPVVLDTMVRDSGMTSTDYLKLGSLQLLTTDLERFIGKAVRVTVELIGESEPQRGGE